MKKLVFFLKSLYFVLILSVVWVGNIFMSIFEEAFFPGLFFKLSFFDSSLHSVLLGVSVRCVHCSQVCLNQRPESNVCVVLGITSAGRGVAVALGQVWSLFVGLVFIECLFCGSAGPGPAETAEGNQFPALVSGDCR